MRPFQEEIVSQTKAGCEGLNAFKVICELLYFSLRNYSQLQNVSSTNCKTKYVLGKIALYVNVPAHRTTVAREKQHGLLPVSLLGKQNLPCNNPDTAIHKKDCTAYCLWSMSTSVSVA